MLILNKFNKNQIAMQRNTNTSNFTYRESQFGPNIIPPPISQLNNPTYTRNMQSGISTFQPQPFASQVRSPQIAQSFTTFPVPPQQTVVQSRGPMIIDQRQITAPRTQPITQYVQSQQPVVHEIVQPKIIEQTVVHHSRLSRGQNQTLYTTDPQVQTVNHGKWMSYYDGQKQLMAPPTKSAAASKTCCAAPLLALLGLLALGGLIAAIVLGARGANNSNSVDHSEYSQGIPIEDGAAETEIEYPDNSITEKTVIIERNNETINKNTTQVVIDQKNNTNISESSSKVVPETPKEEKSVQPFSVSPIAVSPSSKAVNQEKPTSQTSSTPSTSDEGINPTIVKPSAQSSSHSVNPIVVQPQSTANKQITSGTTVVENQKASTETVSSETQTVPGGKVTTTTTTVYREVQPLVAQPVEAHLKLRKYHQ